MAGSQLKYVKFEKGERYPMLLGLDGMPQWYPTLFATLHYRNRSRTAATTYAVLNVIRQVDRWAGQEGIDLIARFQVCDLLLDHEITSLAAFLKRRDIPEACRNSTVPKAKIVTLEQARARPPKRVIPLSSGYAYNRIHVAERYLKWLSRKALQDSGRIITREISVAIEQMATALKQLRPITKRNRGLFAKTAVPKHQQDLVLAITKPDHPDNPYSTNTRQRNQTIVRMLTDLGLRSGEILTARTDDICFETQEILIARRHNDSLDPRSRQPVAKTADRRLPMSDELSAMLFDYIRYHRSQYSRARQHPFLFTSTRGSRAGQAGNPMSSQQLGKVIAALSNVLPTGSAKLHPHIFRHNAATEMAQYLHANGASYAEIEKILNAKFGWAEGSSSASNYIEEQISKLALEAQLAMQGTKNEN